MKLEEGMYVRTNDGYIAKIKEIEANERLHLYLKAIYTDNYQIDMVLEDTIIKASHNIIDLIEVGDYVNGFKIIRRFVNTHNGKKLLIALEKEEGYEYSNNLNDYMGDDSIHIYDEDIKTIVTSQQMESMQYEVKQ